MKPVPPIVTLSLLAAYTLGGCHHAPPWMTSLSGTSHPAYTITDLGAGVPSGINNRGQINAALRGWGKPERLYRKACHLPKLRT